MINFSEQKEKMREDVSIDAFEKSVSNLANQYFKNYNQDKNKLIDAYAEKLTGKTTKELKMEKAKGNDFEKLYPKEYLKLKKYEDAIDSMYTGIYYVLFQK